MPRPPTGPSDVLDQAHQWEREALEIRPRDPKRADELELMAARARELVAAWTRLQGAEHSANVRGVMTSAQLARRGQAVSVAKTKGHPLKKAISASDWGSMRVYARTRLHISPSSLTGYLNGDYPCPPAVDKQVRADFPAVKFAWPRGVAAK